MITKNVQNNALKTSSVFPKNHQLPNLLIDDALDHIRIARDAATVNDREKENDHISHAVSIIVRLSKCSDSGDFLKAEIDLLNFCSYIIDRLSLKHSVSEIPPLNEVEWLLKGLQDILNKSTN